MCHSGGSHALIFLRFFWCSSFFTITSTENTKSIARWAAGCNKESDCIFLASSFSIAMSSSLDELNKKYSTYSKVTSSVRTSYGLSVLRVQFRKTAPCQYRHITETARCPCRECTVPVWYSTAGTVCTCTF